MIRPVRLTMAHVFKTLLEIAQTSGNAVWIQRTPLNVAQADPVR